MKYRILGRTGLNVSLLSYGSGGPTRMGQSYGLSFDRQRALVHRCVDLGMNLFDTAPAYGESEEILGRILSEFPRDQYYLATKWAPEFDEGGLKEPDDLVLSLEDSLRRLRTDCIDLYQMHAVHAPSYMQVVERYYEYLLRFREQGKIRFIGLTEDIFPDPSHDTSRMALREHPGHWDTMMIKYGILNQNAAKESFPLILQHNIGVLNMSPVRVKLSKHEELCKTIAAWKSRGLIAADCVPDDDPLGWVKCEGVETVVAAGYKFAVDHPAISTVVTGASTIEHLEENCRAVESPPLPDKIKQRLVALFGELAEPD